VKEVFEEDYGLGTVDRVDMVPMTNDKGESFKRVFVHFEKWGTSEDAVAARSAILGGQMIQMVYDEPWYWKVGKSHVAKPERRDGRKATGKKGGPRSLKVIKSTRKSKPTQQSKSTQQIKPEMTIGDIKEKMDAAEKELSELRSLMSQKVDALVTAEPASPPLVVRKPIEGPIEGWGGELRTTPSVTPSVVDEVAQGVADAAQEKESDEAVAVRKENSKDLCGN
jgi:hypothetical protein